MVLYRMIAFCCFGSDLPDFFCMWPSVSSEIIALRYFHIFCGLFGVKMIMPMIMGKISVFVVKRSSKTAKSR